MNSLIPIVMGLFAAVTAIATAFGNANGLFSNHPYAAYWLYGLAALLGITALVLWRITPQAVNSAQRTIESSFNPQNTLTANPTINVYPPTEPQREVQPTHSLATRSEPNLILCRVWRERLFRSGDEFRFHVSNHEWNRLPSFSVIGAEIKNTSSISGVGCANGIKAELVFDDEKGSVGPMTWVRTISNTTSIEMGDAAVVLLALYLPSPFTKVNEWRLPVNPRSRAEYLPGAELIDLRQWSGNKKGSLKLNIIQPKSGQIVESFRGTYEWPGGELEPKFQFMEQQDE